MIAIDTNVVVQLLTGDDPRQARESRALFEASAVFIADTVVLEAAWVLRFAYDFEPLQVCGALRKLFGLSNVRLSDAAKVALALDWCERGLDFVDALHLAHSQQAASFKTFDAKLIKRSKKLSSCVVERP